MPGTAWTDDELEKLRELWPSATHETLKKEFPGRSIGAIRDRASLIKVRRTYWHLRPVKIQRTNPLAIDLTKARVRAKMSQNDLTRVVGTHQSNVSRFEKTGLAGVSLFTLLAWCDALGLELRARRAKGKKARIARPPKPLGRGKIIQFENFTREDAARWKRTG